MINYLFNGEKVLYLFSALSNNKYFSNNLNELAEEYM